jgi:protein-S-isoprenylcysteine O-methyltransferase Ste14
MIGGKSWLDLVVVSGIALGFITLMVVIQALQHERTREEIIRGVALVWGSVALTLLLAWLLEDHWGGALIDVQVYPRPDVITRPMTGTQTAVLAGLLAAILGLYIGAILTVRKLTSPRNGLTVTRTDESGDAQ